VDARLRIALAGACAAAALAVAAPVALAQPRGGNAQPRAELRLEDDDAFAGMPFRLSLVADGFAEDPMPAQPTLAIPGVRVSPLGGTPNTTMIQINGQRMDRVTWVYQWRIEADKPGDYTVPALTLVQGQLKATTRSARLRVGELPTTDDMKLEVGLPDRPVWVGETITVPIHWYLRSNPGGQDFSVPLLGMDDMFSIAAPPVTNPRQALEFTAGSRDLQLPYVRDDVTLDGKQYARFSFEAMITPKKAGTIDVPPASVAALLEVPGRRDFFGQAPTKRFRVADVAHTLEVKPLPQTGRPASFAGAVGTSFSISVTASRSVVSLGEPVDLEITVRGDQRLDTLALGPLVGAGGLPGDKFTAPDQPPTGVLSDDARTKTFTVPVQVIGATKEIPALAFAYFDPVKAVYEEIHSEPIALSLKGGTMVGADDVVAIQRGKGNGSGAAPGELSLVGADLALSAPDDATRSPLGGTFLWVLISLLYAVPVGVLAFRIHRNRTAERREEASEVTAARRAFEYELSKAAAAPARDSVGPLVAAVRAIARSLGRDLDDGGLLARLETEAFAPDAASSPLAAAHRDAMLALVKSMLAKSPKARGSSGGGGGKDAAAVVALLVGLGAGAGAARADALSEGRGAYRDALATSDPASRRAAFRAAEERFAQAIAQNPGRPDLLADWGNAALGAGDVGTATLAFRRALAIDGSNERARRNLAWLRSKLPDSGSATTSSATDTLFFFHAWPRGLRILVGAGGFAIAVLLLVPWGAERRRSVTAAALVPGALWLAMTVSVLVEDRKEDDGVVMEAAMLRAADSAGAPASRAAPVPPGSEVTILERRDTWLRVRLGGGVTGWLPSGTVEPVANERN
jgi:hypothetical protein